MRAIIRYPNAQRVEVLVLSIGRYAMRVVPRASDDTIELRLNYDQWTDESGVPIEFDSFVAAADDDIRSMLEMPQVRTAAS